MKRSKNIKQKNIELMQFLPSGFFGLAFFALMVTISGSLLLTGSVLFRHDVNTPLVLHVGR